MRYGIALLLCAYAYGLSFQATPPVPESSARVNVSTAPLSEPTNTLATQDKQIGRAHV